MAFRGVVVSPTSDNSKDFLQVVSLQLAPLFNLHCGATLRIFLYFFGKYPRCARATSPLTQTSFTFCFCPHSSHLFPFYTRRGSPPLRYFAQPSHYKPHWRPHLFNPESSFFWSGSGGVLFLVSPLMGSLFLNETFPISTVLRERNTDSLSPNKSFLHFQEYCPKGFSMVDLVCLTPK